MRRAVIIIWVIAVLAVFAVESRRNPLRQGVMINPCSKGLGVANACAPTWTPVPQTATATQTGTATATATATQTATPGPTCAPFPTGLIATAASSTQINLSWVAPCGTVTGYQIWRGDGTRMVLITTTGTSATTYSDGAVVPIAPSTTWSYQVAAIIAGVPTALSSVASATTSNVAGRSIPAITCPGGAINLTTANDITAAVTAQPAGTTFCFAAGTYRAANVATVDLLVPKANDTFLGGTGVNLKGSQVISAWTLTAGTYKSNSTTLQSNPGDYDNTNCNAASPLCGQTQDMYRDGVPLIPVASHAALLSAGTGHWFWTPGAGGATGTAEVFDNPAGHTLELSIQRDAIVGNAITGVTFKGFAVSQFASRQQGGAIGGSNYPGNGWIIQSNEVAENHYGGIYIGAVGASTQTVTGNWSHDNGDMNVDVNGTGNVVTGNEMGPFTNWAGYSCGFECGDKNVAYSGTYAGNYIHDMTSGSGLPPAGIWFDVQAYNDTVQNNHIKSATGQCVFYEISCNGIIKQNWCDQSGGGAANFVFTGGIILSTSSFTTVDGNIVTLPASAPANNTAISLITQNRGNGSGFCYNGVPLLVRSNTIKNNIATIAGANQFAAVLTQDNGDNVIYSDANTFGGTGINNTYNGLANSTTPFGYNQGNRNCTYWHSNVESGATCNN